MTQWAVVLKGEIELGKYKYVYVRKYGVDKKGEHTSAVFDSKVGACNCARKVARNHHMEYLGSKTKLGD